MSRASLGSFAHILGSLVISLELYGLNHTGLEMQKGSWETDAMGYAKKCLFLWQHG